MTDLDPALLERARTEGLTLLIGSGSVAAANLGGLAYELGRAAPAPVVALLTQGARRFVTPAAVAHLGGCPVLDDDAAGSPAEPLHVLLTELASRVLVYPASAGFMGRVASGLATDLASTTLLCATGTPTLVVPAMHRRMWTNPLVQHSVQRLRWGGLRVLDSPDGVPPPIGDVVRALLDTAHAVPAQPRARPNGKGEM